MNLTKLITSPSDSKDKQILFNVLNIKVNFKDKDAKSHKVIKNILLTSFCEKNSLGVSVFAGCVLFRDRVTGCSVEPFWS